MSTLDLTKRTGGGTGNGEARVILPSDSYRMKCLESKLEDDTFAKPNPDGSFPQKIALTFEMAQLTDEQQEIAEERDEDWTTVRIWHRFNPFYGDVRAGGPSKFKEFLDNLVSWGCIPALNLEAFDPSIIQGVELKCSVVQYTKTMGENAGKPGNKITGFASVRNGRKKNTPTPLNDPSEIKPAATGGVVEEPLPF
jgi:hypothetical protein